MRDELDNLDPLIRDVVLTLHDSGVETFESCQSGPNHSFLEPTVRFHGNAAEGIRALGIALVNRYHVTALRRYWDVIDGEPTGPHWEMTFYLGVRR